MTITGETLGTEWQTYGESPFAEPPAESAAEPSGFMPAPEGPSPFAESPQLDGVAVGEAEALLAEVYDSLRDEAFDEAISALVAETAQMVGERFEGEAPGHGAARARRGDAHLAPVHLEAERYLDSFAEGVADADLGSFSDQQLEAFFEGFDPAPAESALSPASEQFLGSIVQKARSAVGSVLDKTKKVAGALGKAAGKLAEQALNGLRGLIEPLLKRVLSFAIGRLPAPLQGPARTLAAKIKLESAAESPVGTSPALSTDPDRLAEQFDAALAEIVMGAEGSEEPEAFAGSPGESDPAEGLELEVLAEARAGLVERLGAGGDGDDLAPAVENFVPALLGALKAGINLVGRQRVVGFLAKFLADKIRPWTSPQMAGPLSTAIVDTGLKLISLEAEQATEPTPAPVMLAATIEDTVRGLTEAEDYVFDTEELLQLATLEAFERAVATNFPARFVKVGVQQAPSLGGSFVTVHARSVHPFRSYSRAPEVEVTAQVADALRSFGGTTLGDALRAAEVTLPLKARVHVYEAMVGTTLVSIAAADPRLRRLGTTTAVSLLHPLTPEASGSLLREPQLGSKVPDVYLASRGRLGVGQRVYWLETPGSGVTARALPSQSRLVVDLPRGQVRVAVFLSEADAQAVAAAARAGRGTTDLLRALAAGFERLRFIPGDRSVIVRRESPDSEERAADLLTRVSPAVLTGLRTRIRGWYLPMAAQWTRGSLEEFSRAATAPADGVTVRVVLSAVPGLGALRNAMEGRLGPAELRAVTTGGAFAGTPSGAVSVQPGRRLR